MPAFVPTYTAETPNTVTYSQESPIPVNNISPSLDASQLNPSILGVLSATSLGELVVACAFTSGQSLSFQFQNSYVQGASVNSTNNFGIWFSTGDNSAASDLFNLSLNFSLAFGNTNPYWAFTLNNSTPTNSGEWAPDTQMHTVVLSIDGSGYLQAFLDGVFLGNSAQICSLPTTFVAVVMTTPYTSYAMNISNLTLLPNNVPLIGYLPESLLTTSYGA